MTARDVVGFAAGALGRHRLRTGLSLVGVAIGVTSVVLLTSLGEGARLYVTGEFASLGANLLIVRPGKTETTGFAPPLGGAPHDFTLDDVEAIRRRVPGIRHAAPLAFGTAIARVGDLTRDVNVAGTTAEWKEVRRIPMRVGQFLPGGASDRDRAICVIGAAVQRELFRGRNPLGEVLRVGDERFRVIGVVAPRGTSLGLDVDEMVFIPVERHMKMFNLTSLFNVMVEVSSREDLERATRNVIAVVKERHDGEEDVTAVTQDSMLTTFSNLLGMLTAALAGIAAVSLSVAGLGIMNVMLVSVSERTREVGVLKALGATHGQVMRLFLTEAATLSTIGGLAGLALAWGAIAVVRMFYPDFPMQPPSWAMPSAIAVSLAVGVVFGVLPARRAAKLDPIGALSRR